jgi:hypothetical protein
MEKRIELELVGSESSTTSQLCAWSPAGQKGEVEVDKGEGKLKKRPMSRENLTPFYSRHFGPFNCIIPIFTPAFWYSTSTNYNFSQQN